MPTKNEKIYIIWADQYGRHEVTVKGGTRPSKHGAFNPLSPQDVLKHHFTSLKINLIFLQPSVLEQTFS